MADEPEATESTQETLTPEGGGSGQEAVTDEIGALKAQVATATAERDAARIEAAQNAEDLRLLGETDQARINEAEKRVVDTHRRALLAEHRGHIVEELVAGATVEEIEASVTMASAAYNRTVEAVRAQLERERPTIPNVPAGASPRAEPEIESLSPLAKIAGALTRNSHS